MNIMTSKELDKIQRETYLNLEKYSQMQNIYEELASDELLSNLITSLFEIKQKNNKKHFTKDSLKLILNTLSIS